MPFGRDALVFIRDQVGFIERLDTAPEGTLEIRIQNADAMEAAISAVRGIAQPVVSLSGLGATDIVVSGQGNVIRLELSDEEKLASDERTVQQSLEIIRRRIDEVGTREPTIQRQGTDRILIQVPGIGSAARAAAQSVLRARGDFHPVRGRPCRRAAEFRPERPPLGQLPVQSGGRTRLRQLHLRKRRRTFRRRPR